ncbi:MAG: DUF3850 domain-containing protein [Candidatus Colwellbacteria bacterium]|nr:DUF3850 domain-containing protein [Candidatus Colwellbacteria bacterium]
MAIIRKKTWPEYFEAILGGRKNFDMRAGDIDIKEGDTLVLVEYDPKNGPTGREISRIIGSVWKFGLDTFGNRDEIERNGLTIMELKPRGLVDLEAVS